MKIANYKNKRIFLSKNFNIKLKVKMDKLFSIGKSLFSAATQNDEEEEDGFSNPFEMFFKLDRDEDGKISEEGIFINNFLNLFLF